MKAWAASFALHALAAAIAATWWLDRAVKAEPSPLRWEVVFSQPPIEAVHPAVPPQATPRRKSTQSVPPAHASQLAQPQPPPTFPAPSMVAPATPSSSTTALQAQAANEAPRPVSPAPAVVEAATGPANTETAAESERQWYLALLERLRTMKHYPAIARRLGQEGVVLVEARISADGQLENMTIKRSSGYPLLDRSALQLLEIAAGNARGQLRPERPTRLEIPIAYRLES